MYAEMPERCATLTCKGRRWLLGLTALVCLGPDVLNILF